MNVYQTPVVIIMYKRPAHVRKVIESMAMVKPREIYLIADGAKTSAEKPLVKETRRMTTYITWPCHLHKIYASSNLGLRKRVVTGLNAVFREVDRAIILEDDCVPEPSFYWICQTLLAKYQHVKNIGTISGTNYTGGMAVKHASYYFSRYPHSWGWATWRRAWEKYDDAMLAWPKEDVSWFTQTLSSPLLRWYWATVFHVVKKNGIDSWAYRWTYTCLKHHLLTIIPAVNLVKNIGFGKEATHTRGRSALANLPTGVVTFPLRHPVKIRISEKHDRRTEKNLYLRLRSMVGISILAIKNYYV